jgi:hypothetical protein
MYPKYQDDLNLVLSSETVGEHLFGTAEKLTRRQDRSKKWRRLAELEAETLKRFERFLSEQGAHARPPRLPRLQAWVFGSAFGLLPWRLAMHLLEKGTGPFLEAFQRLQREVGDTDLAFFQHLVAHEQAIIEFTRRERDGKEADSLAPVDALLGER